jgi:hypothetical protein
MLCSHSAYILLSPMWVCGEWPEVGEVAGRAHFLWISYVFAYILLLCFFSRLSLSLSAPLQPSLVLNRSGIWLKRL